MNRPQKIHFWQILTILFVMNSCDHQKSTDTQKSCDTDVHFLSYLNQLPDSNVITSDSLTTEQKQVIKKYRLSVYIPKDFRSIVDENDKEAFIFYNANDTSLILARCFPMQDSILRQIDWSTKYDSPIYGPDYNDLSEFKHFKRCEKMIADSLIGPFLFGGTFYRLLGADNVMHQEFWPKSKKYAFGELTILYDRKKYLFICSFHNGYSEDPNDDARWQAFQFK